MASATVLQTLLEEWGRVVVAYSGGVDSAFLADTAHEVLGDRAEAITAVSPSLAPRERTAARELALARGWNHREITTEELAKAGYRANGGDRCYFCKETLFEALVPLAAASGAVVAVGTNVDDLGDHRPGLRAAADHRTRAPLVDAGYDKAAVRLAAAARGLPVADKPATPCLASRIAYGVEVSQWRLERIAAAEEVVASFGFSDFRVRDHGELARIEVPLSELDHLLESTVLAQVEASLRSLGFASVTVEMRGLVSGGMNAVLTQIERVRP